MKALAIETPTEQTRVVATKSGCGKALRVLAD